MTFLSLKWGTSWAKPEAPIGDPTMSSGLWSAVVSGSWTP